MDFTYEPISALCERLTGYFKHESDHNHQFFFKNVGNFDRDI